MNKLPPELIFEANDSTFARLCIELTFYWRGSMYDRADLLVDAYRRALAAVKGGIRYFETGSMAGAKKLKADSLEMVPFWLQEAKRREDIFMMLLKGGSDTEEPSDLTLQFFADEEEDTPAGALSVSLPLIALNSPDSIVVLMKEIADCADFESGHCGYSVSWEPNGDSAADAEARMLGIAGRFKGVDLPKLSTTVLAMQRSGQPSIKTVQWLTFLGTPVVQRFGGSAKLNKALLSTARVSELKYGFLIQADESPTLADTNRASAPSSINAIGRTLAPLRLLGHAPIFGTDDQMANWLARFDR